MKTIIKIIFLAIISATLAILVEQLAAAAVGAFWQKEIVLESYTRFTWFLAFSAVVEEVSKYWAVYFVIRKKMDLQKIRFVLASLFMGSVWGIFEIGLVLFANQEALVEFQAGNPQILFSFGSIIALHALTAFLMSALISSNHDSGKLKHLQIILFPVLLHLIFNFLIIQKGEFTNYLVAATLAIAFLIGLAILSFNFKRLA